MWFISFIESFKFDFYQIKILKLVCFSINETNPNINDIFKILYLLD